MDNGRLPTVYRLSRPPFFVILSRTNGSLHSRNQALQGFFSRDCGIRMTNAVRDHHDNMGTLLSTRGLEKDLSRACGIGPSELATLVSATKVDAIVGGPLDFNSGISIICAVSKLRSPGTGGSNWRSRMRFRNYIQHNLQPSLKPVTFNAPNK